MSNRFMCCQGSIDAALRPEVFEPVPDLSQEHGEFRLSTHIDREIIFPGHTIGTRIDGRLLDAAFTEIAGEPENSQIYTMLRMMSMPANEIEMEHHDHEMYHEMHQVIVVYSSA